MKPKRLLFALFLLYWAVVYGVTFFAGSNLKSQFRDSIPTGYRMFAPVTDTNYDVIYEFYSDGKLRKRLILSEYIASEYDNSIFQNKSAFVKDRLYLGLMKTLDFHYQKSLYDELYKGKENDFAQKLLSEPELLPLVKNLEKFPILYLLENPEIKTDSFSVSVWRAPMILPFDKSYNRDFTYKVGKKVFYKTSKSLRP